MKNNYTVNYWQKEDCGAWQQITTIKRGGSDAAQTYINSILQEPVRVLNKKYWPHQYTMLKHDPYDLERWCYDNFKSSDWRNHRKLFAFKRQEDASYFLLMWS